MGFLKAADVFSWYPEYILKIVTSNGLRLTNSICCLIYLASLRVVCSTMNLYKYIHSVRVFLQEDELKKSVLVIFANKQDIEGAMTVTEVANSLGLSLIKNRKYQIFKTSAIKGEGLDEAMEWYAN